MGQVIDQSYANVNQRVLGAGKVDLYRNPLSVNLYHRLDSSPRACGSASKFPSDHRHAMMKADFPLCLSYLAAFRHCDKQRQAGRALFCSPFPCSVR
jgi:hypothetical protein